jgi:glycerol-3-phosphate dehydrogenase
MKRDIEKLARTEYDLIVIGGGVSGASAAWDASLRGLRVACIDKGDFGAGTSTATSKLIHGGLRYLKNLEFNLVRESLRERRRLEEIAPHLVYPLPFVIPVYGWLMFMVMFMGMVLYELLSFDKARLKDPSKRLPHFSIHSKNELIRREPNIIRENLVAGFQYYDCQSLNPDRLTLAFVQSAVKAGADVANYARAEKILRDGTRVIGIVATDMTTGREFEIHGKIVLVAAGPWADIVLAKSMGQKPQTRIRRSKGIHILTNTHRTGFALTLPGPHGGHFFIIPWREHTLIGTTDTEFIGKPDECDVTAEDIEQFVGAINNAYGSESKLSPQDVVYAYAGLRPLVDRQATSVYNVSRKHEIVNHKDEGFDGMLSVIGGKYTTSRELAEEVINRVAAMLGNTAPCKTKESRLAGGEIDNMNAFLQEATREMASFGPAAADLIARYYGTDYKAVLALARQNPAWGKPIGHGDEIGAQAVYAVREEMALTLSDIIFRRMGMGTLGTPGLETLRLVAGIAKNELGWSDAKMEEELAVCMGKLDYPRRLELPPMAA